MKTLLLTLLLIGNLANAENVSDQSDILNAQVRTTHDTLEQVLAKMRNSQGFQVNYSNPDFIDAAVRFNGLAENAMVKFEYTLKNEILPQIPVLINRLNSIKHSASFSTAQKEALLNQEYELATDVMKELSLKYQNAIYELYALDLPEAKGRYFEVCHHQWMPSMLYLLPGSGHSVWQGFYEITFKDRKLDKPDPIEAPKWGYCNFNDHHINANQEIKPYEQFINGARNVIFNQTVRQHCSSSSCVSLLANHRLAYLVAIRDDINRNMVFETDG